jgi:hypothetical protein
MFSKKCATCGTHHYEMPVREATGWAVRTLERVSREYLEEKSRTDT